MTTPHKDFIDQPVKVGAIVVYIYQSEHTSFFQVGKVVDTTPTMLRITCDRRWDGDSKTTTLRAPSKCIVVRQPGQTMVTIDLDTYRKLQGLADAVAELVA